MWDDDDAWRRCANPISDGLLQCVDDEECVMKGETATTSVWRTAVMWAMSTSSYDVGDKHEQWRRRVWSFPLGQQLLCLGFHFFFKFPKEYFGNIKSSGIILSFQEWGLIQPPSWNQNSSNQSKIYVGPAKLLPYPSLNLTSKEVVHSDSPLPGW